MTTEKQYLEYLIKQYQNLIYSICLKSVGNPFDAEDLTQEVFLSAYKNLSRFDGNYAVSYTHLPEQINYCAFSRNFV